MARSNLAFLALIAAQLCSAEKTNPVTKTVSVDTGSKVDLSWRVNISYLARAGPAQAGEEYELESESALLWSSSESLDNLVYDIWHDLEPSSTPQNLSYAWFHWQPTPANTADKVSMNGSCEAALGSSCVHAVLSAPHPRENYEGAFNISACNSTLGKSGALPEVIFSQLGPIATPSNRTNSSAPHQQSTGGLTTNSHFKSSNLTAFNEAQSRLQILLLQGLPRNVMTCLIVTTTATRLTGAATVTAAPSFGAVAGLAVLAMLFGML